MVIVIDASVAIGVHLTRMISTPTASEISAHFLSTVTTGMPSERAECETGPIAERQVVRSRRVAQGPGQVGQLLIHPHNTTSTGQWLNRLRVVGGGAHRSDRMGNRSAIVRPNRRRRVLLAAGSCEPRRRESGIPAAFVAFPTPRDHSVVTCMCGSDPSDEATPLDVLEAHTARRIVADASARYLAATRERIVPVRRPAFLVLRSTRPAPAGGGVGPAARSRPIWGWRFRSSG